MTDWREQAACKNADVNLFYPEQGDPGLEALAICEGCPVRSPCLEYHLREQFGIHGGMTAKQKVKERARRRAKGITIPPAPWGREATNLRSGAWGEARSEERRKYQREWRRTHPFER